MFADISTREISGRTHFFLFGVCANAEPAAVLEFLLVLLSRKTLDAAEAERGEVTFFELFAVTKTPLPLIIINLYSQPNYND